MNLSVCVKLLQDSLDGRPSGAADRVQSRPTLFDGEQLRTQLMDLVLASPSVPARRNERAAMAPLMDAFFDGLGDAATGVLSANLGRAGARLVRLVAEEQRVYMTKASFEQVVELRSFEPSRATDRLVSGDRFGDFKRSFAYDGWIRSMFSVEWFDSRTERTVANALDGDERVEVWVRLHINELPILWNSAGREYNPDLLVVDGEGIHWVVEVKMGKEIGAADVLGKREAARRWANHVSADEQVNSRWRFLLVSESDVEMARGSWAALKRLGD
jgi:type III restriction enzyme